MPGEDLEVRQVTGVKRTALAPEMPTVAETAVPGFESLSWTAPYAPAGTAAAIVQKLSGAINSALEHPEVQPTLQKTGLDAVGGTVEELVRYQTAEIVKWAKVVKTIGYVPE
jgi:tripartite-type tricarboxylate transporter receptor subunit TctC